MRLSAPAVLLFAGSCSAAEWYICGYAGAASTHPATVRIDQPSTQTALVFDRVSFAGRSFESPLYYGYRLGAFLTNSLGLEAEFIHAKIHAQIGREVAVYGSAQGRSVSEVAPVARYARKLDESHGLNFLLGNAVFRRNIGRVAFTARAGAGVTIPHPETEVLGAAREDYQIGGPALHVAAGAEVRVWRAAYILGEYKHTWTRQRIDVAGGEARFRLQTEHLVTGVALHF
jgi:lipid A oxidase